MSSERAAVNGDDQHVVSTRTNMSSEDADECAEYASTIAKSHQASALKLLNADADPDAVIVDAMATDVDADPDNHNVQVYSSSKDESKVYASRKRSRQRNGDTSNCRNSRNRAAATAAPSHQIRPLIDDFDTLFDEIRANGDGDGDGDDVDVDVAIVQTDGGGTLQRAAIKVKDGVVVCDQETNGNDDVNGFRVYSTYAVSQHSHTVLTTSSDSNTNHQVGIDVDVEVDADANPNPNAEANVNAFAKHQQREVISVASDSLTGEPVNTNSAAAVDSHQHDVPYRTSTNGRPTPILSSENAFTLVEKSYCSTSTSTSTTEQCSLIEECRYNIPDDVIKDVVRRESKYSSIAEKKTTKKKKSIAVAAAAATTTTTTTGNGNATSSSITSTTTSTSTSASVNTTNATTNGVTPKTKKNKKSKKYSDEKENISVVKSRLLTNNNHADVDVDDDLNFHQILDDGDEFSNVCVRKLRSGFGKFDQLTKKTLLHVRSQDSSKAQHNFSQGDDGVGVGVAENAANVCKACSKTVFAMELIKAERAIWHKNCFRCSTCGKQLTVDIYSSHEGKLYCKPHFKDLFKPKVVVEDETPVKLRKPELIIRENQPLELPPDVIRACDKPDLGLDELSNLNVKSRFQVFEKQNAEEDESATDRSAVCVKRSPSILSKLAKFQAKGMDVGVSSDIFNGIDYEESASSEDEQDQTNTSENSGITKNVVSREKPVAFNKMNDVKKNWENGNAARKEERREERREELQRIRSRLFMGKQNKMREAYENAVAESEKCNVKKDVEVKAEKARLIKEKFEKGEIVHYEDSDEEASASASSTARKSSGVKDEDMDVFEAGISKKSRTLFQQMDAAVKTSQSKNPPANSCPQLRSHVPASTTTLQNGQSQKSNSPEKDVATTRCEDNVQDEDESQLLKKSHTTAKMLSLFRQLEEAQQVVPDGPKPMKKFTPPPVSSECSSDDNRDNDDDDEEEESTDGEDTHADAGRRIVRASDKTEDEYLKVAQAAAKAKSLKEKFEKWQPEKQSSNNAVNLLDSEQASLDTAKSLTARFESFRNERQTSNKPRPKVNRFVDKSSKSSSGCCNTCLKTVYQLEKVEAGDKIFHRSCFRCSRCNGVLRMETFTMNNGQLYCVPHFKQMFIVKGNYDEGFGNDQHKNKWSTSVTVTARPDVVPTTVTNSAIANTLM